MQGFRPPAGASESVELIRRRYRRFRVLGLASRPIMLYGRGGGTMPRLSEAMALAAMTLLGATLPAVTPPRRPQGAASQRTLILVAEIMDSPCAMDGTHASMMGRDGRTKATG